MKVYYFLEYRRITKSILTSEKIFFMNFWRRQGLIWSIYKLLSSFLFVNKICWAYNNSKMRASEVELLNNFIY